MQTLTHGFLVQISYARQLITLEQRNRVINIMNRFRLPLWHVVCHPSLFWKVCSTALEFTEKATCCWIPSSRQSSVTQARILGTSQVRCIGNVIV